MPKVLQLISSSGFFGADNVLIELSKQLKNTTFSPFVGVFNNSHNPHLEIAEEAEKHDLPVRIFPCKGRFDLNSILLIRKFVEAQGIDIIHTHGYKSNLYALAASTGKKVSLVATCHNWLGDQTKMKFYAQLDKFFLRRFDRVVAVSDRLRDEILNQNIHPGKVETIYNGIDLRRFNNQGTARDTKKALGIGESCPVVGTVGRISEEKGHVLLLHAAEKVLKKYPDTVFVFVGDGPLKEELETKSSQICTGLKNIGTKTPLVPFIFTGVRNDMPAIYSMIDIFVLPSLTEGLPMVILEAMASGKPVIAAKVGAIPKVVEHDYSGLLVPPGNVKELTEAILQLLDNPDKSKQLAKNARKTVEEQFSSKIMAERYIEVYEDVLGMH